MTSKELYFLSDEPRLWKVFTLAVDKDVLQGIRRQQTVGRDLQANPLVTKEEIEIARQCSLLRSIDRVKWMQTKYVANTAQLEPMEGHTMNLLMDRYLIIVGGWGGESPNEVSIIDGLALPNKILPIGTSDASNLPRFRYGFSTMVFRNRVFVYGGCRQGGYSQDCNGKLIL